MSKIDEIAILKSQGAASVVDIDIAVKVNDAPAISAFNALRKSIKKLREITENKIELTLNKLGLYIWTASIVLLLLFVALLITVFQLLRPVQDLTRKLKTAQREDESFEHVCDNYRYVHQDEFGELLKAIRLLITKRADGTKDPLT